MSASPVLLSPYSAAPRRTVRTKWLYAFFSILFVACTSNDYFGGIHTGALLNSVWRATLGSWHYDMRGDVNEFLRKTGHFFGYGMVGLIFRNAWYTTARTLSAIARHWIIGIRSLSRSCVDVLHRLPRRVASAFLPWSSR